jgi:hypothetical protein
MPKHCSRCGTYRQDPEFNRARRKCDRLRSECRLCQKADDKSFRRHNLEKVRARARIASKKWRDQNLEKALAMERRWRHRKLQQSKVREDEYGA